MKFLKIEHIERCYIRDERPCKSIINIQKWPAIINIDHIISVVEKKYPEADSPYVQINMIDNPHQQTTFVVDMTIEQFYKHVNTQIKKI